jgi:hypothetical protein
MVMLAAELAKRGGGDHPVRRTVATIGCLASVGVGVLSGLGMQLKTAESVTAGRGTLKLVALINPEVCGAELVAHVDDDKAAWHLRAKLFGVTSPNLVSYSESYSGDIGAKICVKQAQEVPTTYDAADDKYVVTINKSNAFSMTEYEVNPGEGFSSDNSITGAELTDFTDEMKAAGMSASWTDKRYNGLENIALLEAFRVTADTCGKVALAHLTNPTATKVNYQTGLDAPTTIQGQIINSLVANANALTPTTHTTFTANNFAVNITGSNIVSIPTQYDSEIATLQKAHPSGLSFPAIHTLPSCVDATGKG